jgi:hypothetical protein
VPLAVARRCLQAGIEEGKVMHSCAGKAK